MDRTVRVVTEVDSVFVVEANFVEKVLVDYDGCKVWGESVWSNICESGCGRYE